MTLLVSHVCIHSVWKTWPHLLLTKEHVESVLAHVGQSSWQGILQTAHAASSLAKRQATNLFTARVLRDIFGIALQL